MRRDDRVMMWNVSDRELASASPGTRVRVHCGFMAGTPEPGGAQARGAPASEQAAGSAKLEGSSWLGTTGAPGWRNRELDQLLELFELRSLGDGMRLAQIAPADAARLLDRELQRVALWALVAIALGWDTRRIGFANESAHPFEHEVAAILGFNSGHAREHLDAAEAKLREYERVLEQIS